MHEEKRRKKSRYVSIMALNSLIYQIRALLRRGWGGGIGGGGGMYSGGI